jgi:serine/threonine-protein kinase
VSSDVGPYRLDGLLGRGGMGEVHRAWDTRRRRWVALKLLDARTGEDPDYRRRFRREAEVAARLSEPHVVPVHDYGEIDGRLFLDMRLVDGQDLAALLREGPLGATRTLTLLTHVAAALDAAHAAGLVHRDVKPSNVLVAPGDFAYVADFGLVHDRRDVSTAGADVLGTLDYMAPERLRGDPVDARTDVYALACMLVECLTGTRPFPAEESAELVAAHLYRDPPRITDRDPALPARLDDVVARGMAKGPDDRYPSAGALLVDVAAALDPAGPRDATRGARAPTPPPGGSAPPRPTRVATPDPDVDAPSPRWRPRRGGPLPRRVVLAVAVVATVLVVVAGTVAVRRYVGDGFAVGLSPVAVVFSSDGAQALVVNAGSRAVSVLDTRRRVVTRRIPVDGRAVGAVGVGADRVAVATIDGTVPQAVAVLDLASDTVTATVPLPLPGIGPPVADLAGRRLAVPGRTTVAVLDLARGAVDGAVPPGTGPLAMTPDGHLAVANARDGAGEIDVIDLGDTADRTTLTTTGPVDALVADESGRVLHAAVGGPAPGLETLDLAGTGGSTVSLPAPARALAVAPDGRVIAAVDTVRPGVVAVSPQRSGAAGRVAAVGVLDEFTGPVAMAVTRDGREVWVANTDLGTVTVLPLPR